MDGRFGEAIWLFMNVTMPAMSIAYAVSAVGTCVFAAGDHALTRALAILGSLLVATFIVVMIEDFAVAFSIVLNVTLLLPARYFGLRLVHIREHSSSVSPPATSRGREVCFVFLFWIPLAVAYLLVIACFCPVAEITAQAISGLCAESTVLSTMFLIISYACLRAKTPQVWVVLVLVVAWPIAGYLWAWPCSIFLLLGYWPHAADRTWLLLLWGTPAITVVSLACRYYGYRFIRVSG
jgi:hypothetical protein